MNTYKIIYRSTDGELKETMIVTLRATYARRKAILRATRSHPSIKEGAI